MDNHGASLPMFNLRGASGVSTCCGGVLTFITIYITFLFALLKLTHLVAKKNPVVNTFARMDFFSSEDVFRPDEENYMMAFAVEDYLTGESKLDSRYVKWAATFIKADIGTNEP